MAPPNRPLRLVEGCFTSHDGPICNHTDSSPRRLFEDLNLECHGDILMNMDANSLHTVMYLWAFFGIVLILIDLKLTQTIVLFLLGVAAVSVGVVLSFYPLYHGVDHIKLFLFSTVLWTLLLWRPLQRYKHHNSETFHNLRGRIVVLQGSELLPGKTGKAKWSGTIVEVKLEAGCDVSVPSGAELKVVKVEGTLFRVRPVEMKNT